MYGGKISTFINTHIFFFLLFFLQILSDWFKKMEIQSENLDKAYIRTKL